MPILWPDTALGVYSSFIEISLFNKLAEEIVCRTGLQFLMTEPLSWLAAKNLLASALAARGQEGDRGGGCHAWTGEVLHQATDPCQRRRAAYGKYP